MATDRRVKLAGGMGLICCGSLLFIVRWLAHFSAAKPAVISREGIRFCNGKLRHGQISPKHGIHKAFNFCIPAAAGIKKPVLR